ncbi:hypothetical protein HOP40_27735 [Pseudonocardia broussonetiae]|uniref:DNA alkylation repair enzyme n=1 Tax=Pseudonocardia broussonetiae TaxID=2736640 RepID=A0A6M6JU58_9PSEU|nr:hypothetical protein HOP40_27735 [Pseudonocardia broussonetiae]
MEGRPWCADGDDRGGVITVTAPSATGPRPWRRGPDDLPAHGATGVGSGPDTDLALLTDTIEATLDNPDFFLRKGIGWALRQHGRVDPEWVRAFVAAHAALSPLSRKEALRHLQA